jgi:MarR family 2-MHQ and catechol resistance regulon transcriptional repressor
MAGPDKKAREILRLRRALTRAEQALAEAERALLAPHQLCASDLETLERLAQKGPTRVNALAPRVGLTSGSMTTAVQRLRKRELVRTQRDLADKRVVWVEVTPTGRALAADLLDQRAALLGELFVAWSGREQAILANFLKRLRKDTATLLLDGAPVE